MKNLKLFSAIAISILTVSACSMPRVKPANTPGETALPVVITSTPAAVVTATQPVIVTATQSPTATSTSAPAASPTSNPNTGTTACTNQAEFVTDLSIPDGSVLDTNVDFVKTWRIKNTGTCTWDTQYSVVFVDGTLMMPENQVHLAGAVAPGQTKDLSLGMTSPIYPGNYESDWKLRSSNGTTFGIGSKNTALWIKIIVSSPDVATISGYVYQDRNGNSIYDGNDELMGSQQVNLFQGSCGQSGTPLASAMSGSDGRYYLSGSFSGTMCVVLNGSQGQEDASTVSIASGQNLSTVDLRARVPGAMISGWVWDDSLQPDGVPQPNESYISGVVVLVQRGQCGSPISVPVFAITNPQGYYIFNDLYSGAHCVSIHANEGNNAAIFTSGDWTYPAGGIQQVTVGPTEEGVANFGWQFK